MILEEALIRLEERALREHYPSITIKNYKSKLTGLGEYYTNIAIEDISQEQIQEYLNVRIRRDKVSPQTLIGIKAALKFFYNRVLEKNFEFDSIKRAPKRKLTGEELFTKEEIAKLIKVSNFRYRLIFSLMYHFELDRREILGLRVQDIEKQADGRIALKLSFRERSEKLPDFLGKELQDYFVNNRPTKWLFEAVKGKPLSAEAMHNAFNKSLMVAGIHKKLYPKAISASHVEHSRQAGVALIDEILSSKTGKTLENFVDTKQIDELRQIQTDRFDLRKLIRLCEELNGCYTREWFFATSILQRAILDHVPPIFECKNFSEVVNNYTGGKSFKTQMEHLQNFARTTADSAVHGMVRKNEVLLNQTQVDFRSAMGALIAEIIRILR